MQAIDLNLLPMLVTVLEEENVTRAAARLNLSVPATSRALDRARRLFGDPLLVKSGRGVVMTPRARALLPELTEALDAVANAIQRPGALQPERIRRTFVIRANEAVIAAAGAGILELAAQEAPRAEVRFELETADDMAALRQGVVDLAIGSYSDVTTDVISEDLLGETMVAVVRSGHPLIRAGSRPSLTKFASLSHIVVSRRGRGRSSLDALLREHGRQSNAASVVPSFSVALSMVVRSDATTMAPSRLASIHLDHGALVRFVSPVPMPEVVIAQLWHGSNTADQPHQWLRSCVRRAAARVDAAAG